jgi:hypothetical protein
MTIKPTDAKPPTAGGLQNGIGRLSRHVAASESQSAAVFSASVAVLLFLVATIVSYFWASSLHESHFRADVLTTLKWVQYASVLAAAGSIILCLMPSVRAVLWSRWGIFLIPWGYRSVLVV